MAEIESHLSLMMECEPEPPPVDGLNSMSECNLGSSLKFLVVVIHFPKIISSLAYHTRIFSELTVPTELPSLHV